MASNDDENSHSHNHSHSQSRGRSCHALLVTLLRRSLTRLHNSCGGGGGGLCGSNDHTASFHDITGVGVPMTQNNNNNNNQPRMFSYAELYIGTQGFSHDQLLGSGGFGRVYKAILPSDATLVAVKCLAGKGEGFEKSFAAELVSVAHLRHRNLVRLRGWCLHEEQLLLVYDYMPNRSLDTVLFNNIKRRKKKNGDDRGSPCPLSFEQRHNIVQGLAAALSYLHHQLETQIIHRDVKPSNVMLDSQFNARLGDFGLARWVDHHLIQSQVLLHPHPLPGSSSSRKHDQQEEFRMAETTRIGGTVGYLPPESFQKRYVATAKSDVFGFGIVALELASGRRALDLAYPDDAIVLVDWVRGLADHGNLLLAADPRLSLTSSSSSSYTLASADMERLIHVGLLCTLHDPNSRPNMKWAMDALSANLLGNLPPLPPFKAHPRYISLSTTNTTTTSSGNTISTSSRSRSKSSKSTTTTTTTTTTTDSYSTPTLYLTATGKTIFVTAEAEAEAEPEVETETETETETTETRGGIKVGGEFKRDIAEAAGGSNSTITSESKRNPYPVVDTAREISYAEIVKATNNFSDENRVAELDFGTAYQGYLEEQHQHVLVKRLGMKTCPALRDRFSTELHNIGRLRHRNLVHLRGWCTQQGEMLVVYDYLPTRLLTNLLFHPQPQSGGILHWHHRYNVLTSLASAILYLHEGWDEQVIHRNITSSSVMVDPVDMNPRLTSFALAEFLTRNHDKNHAHHTSSSSSNSVRGIFGYMSPEYVESGEANTAADIYSFGVVVLEVITGQMAVDFRHPLVLLVKRIREFETTGRDLEELADPELDGEYDTQEFVGLLKLGLACTLSNPLQRPSMRQIASILDKNISSTSFFMQGGHREGIEEWKQRNAVSLSLVKRIQALGIQ